MDEEAFRAFLRKKVESVYIPSAVYRVQFSRHFTFKQAARIVPYLKELGIEALYASPYFEAVPASLHGYDITNPNKINPEIGSEEDFRQFCGTLKQHGMGQILDVVPNHMGISGDRNEWWLDVLENGPASLYASFFDIDWEPVKGELKDKVLLPILGDYYGTALENGDIRLDYDRGCFFIRYGENRLPLAPETYPFILGYGIEELKEQGRAEADDLKEYLDILNQFRNLPERTEKDPQKIRIRNRGKEDAKRRLFALAERLSSVRGFIESRARLFNGRKAEAGSFGLLHDLLNQQAYRLAYWRVASEEVNYRRFFNINELAAIRTEKEEVFRECHRFVFQLLQEEKVQGLRIDHPDGLYDPAEYFRRLQIDYVLQELFKTEEERRSLYPTIHEIMGEEEFKQGRPLYVVAEKILERKEKLPENWSIHGTVGYDFLNVLSGLFVKSDHGKAFEELYQNFIGHAIDFEDALYQKKKFFALVPMASEINMLGHRLDRVSERHPKYRDLTRNNLTLAIREVIAAFPVYRAYISPGDEEVSARDRKYIQIAIAKARSKTPALDPLVYDFLERILLLELEHEMPDEDRGLYRDFVLRFQQISAPMMAKSLEDTVFYIYNRLVSLNEVGGDPERFGVSVDEFHRSNIERSLKWPFGFLASSTHDSKRSEDVRMRIHVLSEIPEEWKSRIEKWAVWNEKHKTLIKDVLEPRRNTECFIYQTLIGVWPNEPLGAGDESAFKERMWNYLLKASREAKIYTSWIQPNAEYEEAVKKFLFGMLNWDSPNPFLEDFLPFQKKIAYFGMWNSLSGLVLKIGSPGVVDTYQGNEIWNYCLVDPDNRQPVDYSSRIKLLNQLRESENLGRSSEEFCRDLVSAWPDGRLKLWILRRGLTLRKAARELFLKGDYLPLKPEGNKERNVVAFIRKKGNRFAVIAASRFLTELIRDPEEAPLGEPVWEDTRILLPEEVKEDFLLNEFTQRKVTVHQSNGVSSFLKVSDIFQDLNAAVLTNAEGRKSVAANRLTFFPLSLRKGEG